MNIAYEVLLGKKPMTLSGQRKLWKFSEYFGKGFLYSEGLFISTVFINKSVCVPGQIYWPSLHRTGITLR